MAPNPLLPLAEAQARLLALAPAPTPETVPLADAAWRWVLDDIVAKRTQPSCDLSVMDGYAIRFADMPGPFCMIGESAAGRPFPDNVGAAETVRIFTGAPLPDGSDTIVVQEEIEAEGMTIRLTGAGPATRGVDVRPRGLDFGEGDVLVAKGARLTPQRLALAAIAGHGTLTVAKRLRVAIAATGDELVLPGAPTPNGGVPESSITSITAQLSAFGAEVVNLGILPDRLDILTKAFRSVRADVLVTTGGASVGDHDLVRPALEAAGAAIDFWKVALKPGRPLMAGRLGETVVLGLPGNPVSSFVTMLLFVLPLVAHMSGAASPLPRTVAVPLGEALPANGPRSDHLRCNLRDGRAFAAPTQDSSMVRILADADGLIVRAPHALAAAIGDSVDIIPLA